MSQADKIQKLITAANVDVEPFWPGLFAKALENQDVGALISGAGAAAPAAAAPAAGDAAAKEEKKEEEEKPKEEEEEESDDDMGLGVSLFLLTDPHTREISCNCINSVTNTRWSAVRIHYPYV